MTLIKLNINERKLKHSYEITDDFGNKRKCDAFIIDYTSGKRVYLKAIQGSLIITTFYKTMRLDDNGDITIPFGRNRIKIGTWEEVTL